MTQSIYVTINTSQGLLLWKK